MAITKADLKAAREGILKVAEDPAQVGIMDRLFYGEQGKAPVQALTNTREWKAKMVDDGILPANFANPQEYNAAKQKWVKENAQQYIDSQIKQMQQGGWLTKREATTGAMGLGVGALIGAAFGGAKGALIGGVLGSLALWAMEKYNLTPDFAKGFVGDAAKGLWGADADPTKIKETMDASMASIDKVKGKYEVGTNPYAPGGVTDSGHELYGEDDTAPVNLQPAPKQTTPTQTTTPPATPGTTPTQKENTTSQVPKPVDTQVTATPKPVTGTGQMPTQQVTQSTAKPEEENPLLKNPLANV